jgi:putative PIN family toxin of toxin-antitoxin system
MEHPPSSLRVMVDANILIAGSVWPRWPYEVLQHALKGDYQLVLTPYIIDQARDRISMRFPGYLKQFETFLDLSGFEQVSNPSKNELAQQGDLVRDPTDIPVALAAIQAQVDYLVSEDKDLTTQDETTTKLRERVTVYLSGTFLREVMGWHGEQLEATRKRDWSDLPET